MNTQSRQIANLPPPTETVAANAETVAALLKSAGDAMRLQILRVLSNNAFGALELSDIFAMRQNAMSHHLKLLSKSGLVNSRREGTHIFYRRSNPQGQYRDLCAAILATADAIALPTELQSRLDSIQESRAAASRDFFRTNAAKFRSQQDLIASYPQYGEAVLATLDRYQPLKNKLALEIGPGEGELLSGLCQRFGQILALDNSAEMLARAENFARRNNLEQIRFICGDTTAAALNGVRAHAITLNMVLHHTPDPAAIIRDLSRHLSDDGVLVIAELCRHDQDWVREACGDLWLGFDPEDLSGWASLAGLNDGGSEFLALKNGFSIQIRQFHKAAPSAGLQPPHRVN
ncbi:MAG: metalloregulator ArsR/SmtB family transcription factor [Porticoccaceae bacterium]|nr:metalloregulator ArsR/SmtB family transcription factor [Porticoccaceae bacterium]